MMRSELLKNDILSIEEDIQSQVIFVSSIGSMIERIVESKTNGAISELEIGFKLGEIYRMLEEFRADTIKLQCEVKLFSTKLQEENGKHILLD